MAGVQKGMDLSDTGVYKEDGMFFGMFDHFAETELPPYFIIHMKKQMPGDLPTQKYDFETGKIVYSDRVEKAYSITNPENSKVLN